MHKGLAASATVFTLLGLMATVSSISVGVGSLQNVLGMSATSNDAQKLEEQVFLPTRNVCVQGSSADQRSNTFQLSSKMNVTLVSEEDDPDNDQKFRATKVQDSTLLAESDYIASCNIQFHSGPRLHHVFEKSEPYNVTVSYDTEVNGKPAVLVEVQEN
ncbi:hypothetical protein [Candidatus Nanohalovita haloferacivicina]|uniref:hypothetical protein n=1 Tax=Candidatus Nanohalovita haloferacivicina TaxID=2978046 RepID=UPI00325FAA9B|nr:hypothetical protein HBNXNv_1074 [Candidatus Nanohalobia archaeon BNXNv]